VREPTYLAHAFGERYDLPIPLVLFVLGGALVVVVSFLLVLRHDAPPTTEYAEDGAVPLRPGPAWAVLSFVVLLLLVAIGLVGTQEVSENLLPTVFWLLVWIAVPMSCGVIGDWTAPVNPFAALSRAGSTPRLRRALLSRDAPLPWPGRLGWWPAVVLYVVLACGELVFNATATQPAVIAVGLIAYGLLCLLAGLLFGPAWLARGEVFSVLFATWGRLGVRRFGAPGSRGLGGGLTAGFDPTPSRTAFVLLLLISVNVDGLLATPTWAGVERRSVTDVTALRLLAFAVLAVLVAVVFAGFALASERAGGRRTPMGRSLSGLLPSLLPIAFGYLLAHNLQYLLVNAQLLGPLLGNPVGHEWWPVHLPTPFNDSFDPRPAFLPSALYWYAGVVAIVAAHVVAVRIAHRHLAAAAARSAARRSEYPWLVAMVGYTMVSLVLIAQPLAR